MENHLLGGAFALSAALAWAFAVILFKRGGEEVEPLSLNLFKNTVALLLLAATLAVAGGGLDDLRGFALKDIGILFISGFLGITVADTLFFYSLNLVGVGIVSIVDTLYSPFILLFSWILLAERMAPLQYAGAALVLGAVLITTRMEPPRDRTKKQLLAGILIGALNMALMGFGIVIAKPVLERFPMIWATALRMAAGAGALFLIVLAMPGRRRILAAFRPSRSWRSILPASVLGAYLSCILWIGGFKYTNASVASILNQTSTVIAIFLAVVLLKETFTRRKFASMVMALAGIVLVIIFRR